MMLKDRVAIVTGAAQGLGRAYALRLAEEGAKVVLADIQDTRPVQEEIAVTGRHYRHRGISRFGSKRFYYGPDYSGRRGVGDALDFYGLFADKML